MPFTVHINLADPAALLGCLAIIAGLALVTALIALVERRAAWLPLPRHEARRMVRCPRRDWEMVAGVARAGLSQAEAAIALHARAAERIDAAEYAFGRLLAECAAAMGLPDAPTPPRPLPVMPRRQTRFAEAPAALAA
jgi:hypothetical protein